MIVLLAGIPFSSVLALLVAHVTFRAQETVEHHAAQQLANTIDARIRKSRVALNAAAELDRIAGNISEAQWVHSIQAIWPSPPPAGVAIFRLHTIASIGDSTNLPSCIVDAVWPGSLYAGVAGSNRCRVPVWQQLLRNVRHTGGMSVSEAARISLRPVANTRTVLLGAWARTGRHWIVLSITPGWLFDATAQPYLSWRVTAPGGSRKDDGSVLYASPTVNEPGALARWLGVAREYRIERPVHGDGWTLQVRTWLDASPWAYWAFAFGLALTLVSTMIWFAWGERRRRMLELVRDMTRELRESRDLLTFVVDNIHDGIYGGTPSAGLDYVSKRLAQMFGFKSAAEMLSCEAIALHADREQGETLRQRLLDESHYENVKVEFLRADGTHFLGLDSSRMVCDESGEPLYYVGAIEDISARLAAEQQAEFVAKYDQLTGLANRRLFDAQAEQLLSVVGSERHALILLNLDRFKHVNDLHGHNVGDMILLEVASRLRSELKNGDLIARLGADQFAVVLQRSAELEDFALAAQSLLDVVRRPFQVLGVEVRATASIGVSISPDDGKDLASLLAGAETALKRAKDDGRNRIVFNEPTLTRIALRGLRLEDALNMALKTNELELYYQPRVSLKEGVISSAEALARWNSPALGAVPPDEFIPIAERSGLIERLGQWALASALREWKVWSEIVEKPPSVGVNASAQQLRGRAYADTVLELLSKHGIPNHGLEIELTESQLLNLGVYQEEALFALKESCIRVALDDFGTGYSNLAYLVHLKIDILKIDRSFVSQMLEDVHVASLVRGIIGLARDFGARVVAEGVETVEQLHALRELGCDEIQGYLLARPMPALEFRDFLRQVNEHGLPPSFRVSQ
jgi:diguanylate cyclase (GGDEF)-like protein/PAS domain S-box-containing protein